MRNEVTIYQFLQQTPNEQDEAWYDWFCRDSALPRKTVKLVAKLRQIAFSKKFDITTTYVFFKNNCPMLGSLYDDFRISDIKTGDVIYTVTPSSGHTADHGRAEVWGRENDFAKPLVIGRWADVVRFFNEN